MIDRDDIGRGNFRAQLLRELRRAARPGVTAIAVLALGATCLGFLVLKIDAPALVGSRDVAFAVATAGGVQPGVDEVRFKGIPAGQVTGVGMRGTQPVITVQLRSSYGPVYRNARAALRPNTPLQDMYLDILDPGTPSAGPATATHPVPADNTDTAVAISDVLDVFNGRVRARLTHLLDDLGNGLRDRGAQLRTAFIDAVPFVRAAGQITSELSANASLTKQLVHNASVMMTALADRQHQLRGLVSRGSGVMATFASRSSDIDATLRGLPPTLTSADSAFTALRGVLPTVDGALSGLEPVAQHLPSSLHTVTQLSDEVRPAVDALAHPVRRLVPLAQALNPVSTSLQGSATLLRPQVPPINRTVDDVAGCLPDLNGFFQWDSSMTKFADSRGVAPRGNVAFGLDSSGALKSPFEFAFKSCSPGTVVPGRLPLPSDEH